MSRHFDIAIAGSGVTGSTLAAAMIAQGVVPADRIALVAERLPPPADPLLDMDIRVFAINRASQNLFTTAGIWPLLPQGRICAYERMCVWDASSAPGERGSLSFDCAEIGEPDLGHIVEGRALQWHSFQTVRKAQVAIIEGNIVGASASRQQAKLRFSDGRELNASLVVAADGAVSAVRAALGIARSMHAYHQTALVTHVRTERPHARTAWQRFLPTGPIALLPLEDGRSSVVWSLAELEAELVGRLDPRDLGAAITKASGGVLGACETSAPVARFALEMQNAEEYVRDRFVLVGDAAHSVHPLAGQGLNLGLADCASLIALLAGVRREEWGDLRLLRRYERERRSENLLLAGAFDGLERMFSNADPALTGLRTAGLSAVARLPPLKRFFARRALGG